jgi:DNA-binding CsgD family transcriptional regulator
MQKLLSDCAELALHAATGQAFHDAFLRSATRCVGAAGGYIVTLSEREIIDASSNLDESRSFAAAIATNAAAMSPREMTSSFSRGSLSTDDVFSAQRCDQLEFFRSYLPRLGVGKGIFRLWYDRDRVHFLTLFCSQYGNYRRFRERGLPALDRLWPVLAIAERLVQQPAASRPDAELRTDLMYRFKLTAAEYDTMSLVLRGLTNPEIAQVSGISVNTVRNRLAVCFPKIGASRRAEAVLLLSEARHEAPLSRRRPLAQFSRLVTAARTADAIKTAPAPLRASGTLRG